jgi:hypothetical protein
MRVERVVCAGAVRATEQVCVRLAAFTSEVLEARGFTKAADATARLERVFPVLRVLLTKRTAGWPFLTIAVGGFAADVGVSYDPAGLEDLSLPLMDLLDPLTEEDKAEITIRHTEEISLSLRELVSGASSDRIVIALAEAVDDAPAASVADRPMDESDVGFL